MTGDLELFLRGLFVNRWRCPHERVTVTYDPATDVFATYCAQCACVATFEGFEAAHFRRTGEKPRLVFVSSSPVLDSYQWVKDQFLGRRDGCF